MVVQLLLIVETENYKNLKKNEYPQSPKSVDSMLETCPISAYAKFKPVEQVKSGISSIELIAELVEVELQKVSLDVMIRVKNTPLCITYGYVYPWKHFADYHLIPHIICFMLSDNFVRCKCRVRLRGICGGISSGIYREFFILFSSVAVFKSGMTSILI